MVLTFPNLSKFSSSFRKRDGKSNLKMVYSKISLILMRMHGRWTKKFNYFQADEDDSCFEPIERYFHALLDKKERRNQLLRKCYNTGQVESKKKEKRTNNENNTSGSIGKVRHYLWSTREWKPLRDEDMKPILLLLWRPSKTTRLSHFFSFLHYSVIEDPADRNSENSNNFWERRRTGMVMEEPNILQLSPWELR